MIKAVQSVPAGQPVHFVVRRDGKPTDVSVTPQDKAGTPTVGIQLGTGFQFPFKVSVNIARGDRRAQRRPDVLAGHLRHAHARLAHRRRRRSPAPAPSTPTGTVGPIGGIQQKIAGGPGRRRQAVHRPARQLQGRPRGARTATCGW